MVRTRTKAKWVHMIRNKIKLAIACFLMTMLQDCNNATERSKAARQGSLSSTENQSGVSPVVYFHGLNLYAELKAMVYNIDSIVVTVNIVNPGGDSVWLYKPILPSDSLIEETFYVRREDNNENLKHLVKQTNHTYFRGSQSLLPAIRPLINDSNLLILTPHSEGIFKTNLARHYDLKALNNAKVRGIFINYSMDFPYIKNRRQVYLKDSLAPALDQILKPAYISVGIKRKDKEMPPDFDELIRVELPDK